MMDGGGAPFPLYMNTMYIPPHPRSHPPITPNPNNNKKKMSCTVRALDAKQMRVQRVLALVEDILNLRACAEGVQRALEEGDLPDVRFFHFSWFLVVFVWCGI